MKIQEFRHLIDYTKDITRVKLNNDDGRDN